MSFGCYAFGAQYFGGAPAVSATRTGTGACTMQPATCAGTGTAPLHGGQQTVWGASGSFPIPFRTKKQGVFRARCEVVVGPFEMAARGRRQQHFRATSAPLVLSVRITSTGAKSDRDRRDQETVRLAMLSVLSADPDATASVEIRER